VSELVFSDERTGRFHKGSGVIRDALMTTRKVVKTGATNVAKKAAKVAGVKAGQKVGELVADKGADKIHPRPITPSPSAMIKLNHLISAN